MPEPVERVAAYIRDAGADARLEEFSAGTPTAEAAAQAAGCKLAQIVKSLVFVSDGGPIVVMVSGDRRADARKVGEAAGCRRPRTASAEEVKDATGFEPGAVAPFPLPKVSRILIDQLLLAHDLVWIGAGSPHHLAALSPKDLVRLSRAQPANIAQG